MLFLKEPQGFNPLFDVVSCFLEHDGKFLLLHRQDHKRQGNTWGVPAGKVGGGEAPLGAIVREVFEESGLRLAAKEVAFFQKVFVRYADYDFVYYMFHAKLSEKQAVRVNPEEHKDFAWVTPAEALGLPLIEDEDACIKLFYKL